MKGGKERGGKKKKKMVCHGRRWRWKRRRWKEVTKKREDRGTKEERRKK